MKCKIIYTGDGALIARDYEDLSDISVHSIIVDVPEGKEVIGIDADTETVKYVDIPKTDIDGVREQLGEVYVALANIIGGM